MNKFIIETPKPFSFEYCLRYLNRHPLEVMHKVVDNCFIKLFKINDQLLLVSISYHDGLEVTCLNTTITFQTKQALEKEIRFLFDLDYDVTLFKQTSDQCLKTLIDRYDGLRICKINNFFETCCWAVIGQQINLTFAYKMKKSLVLALSEKLSYNNEDYYLFFSEKQLLALDDQWFIDHQFSKQKIKYLRNVAHFCLDYQINPNLSYDQLKADLLKVVGIGPWSADYIIMKHFNHNQTYLETDAGYLNACKLVYNLAQKPDSNWLAQRKQMWVGYHHYAIFYMWFTLQMRNEESK